MTQVLNYPVCPECKSKDIKKSGSAKRDTCVKQNWQCKKCGRAFVFGMYENRTWIPHIPKPKPKSKMFLCTRCNKWKRVEASYEKTVCRQCLSKATAKQRKNEYNKERYWQLKRQQPKPVLDTKKLIEEYHSLIKAKSHVDSLVGIPCFGCSHNKSGGFCKPEHCEKLTKWMEETTTVTVKEE